MANPANNADESNGLRTKLIDSAYQCFDRFGVKKTSMEDIAKQAGVSRQSVYRPFSSKQEILESICSLEAVKVNAEVRKRLGRQKKFDELVTEVLLLIVKVVRGNPYLKAFLDDLALQSKAVAKSSRVYQLNREWWGDVMEQAAANGELATDISLDEILSWLLMGQAMLQIRLEGQGEDDESLRRFIRRFVVFPITAQADLQGAALKGKKTSADKSAGSKSPNNK